MTKSQIEIVFSPPRPDLAPSQDKGGFVYRIRDESGRVCISGSVRTLDPFVALTRAKRAASGRGFRDWRVWNAGGNYVGLEAER